MLIILWWFSSVPSFHREMVFITSSHSHCKWQGLVTRRWRSFMIWKCSIAKSMAILNVVITPEIYVRVEMCNTVPCNGIDWLTYQHLTVQNVEIAIYTWRKTGAEIWIQPLNCDPWDNNMLHVFHHHLTSYPNCKFTVTAHKFGGINSWI